MNPLIKKIFLIVILLNFLLNIINSKDLFDINIKKDQNKNSDNSIRFNVSKKIMKNLVLNISNNMSNIENYPDKIYFQDSYVNKIDNNFNTTEIVAMISFYIITILIVIITFLFIDHKI
jgi:hypothetical protein